LQGYSPRLAAEEPTLERVRTSPGAQEDYLHVLNTLIAGITHDLNNTMATINGRVELLLNRPQDQSTMQQLGAALRAITEANHLIRHIQALVNGPHKQGAVMIDLNQLVRDSLQIARSAWFQEFRDKRVPIALAADLNPMPALPGSAAELRIAFLCLLRHAMDTVRPGSGLVIRSWTADEGSSQTIFISISDDIGQPPEMGLAPAVESEAGFGILMQSVRTADSRPPLEFVEAVIYSLGGRIMVHRNTAGGITTCLRFSIEGAISDRR
jgi:signal transduction histidine kinase